MSLYNMVFGMNATAVILMSPFLPRRADEFPRFRDVHVAIVGEGAAEIGVLTRMGGKNMNCPEHRGEGEACRACDARTLKEAPNFIRVHDDGDYAVFVFGVPQEQMGDFTRILVPDDQPLSEWYVSRLREMFPQEKNGPNTQAFIEWACTGFQEPKGVNS